jgi:transposase
MTLSRDLRLRVIDLVATGISRREASRRFKVSGSSAIRFVKQAAELGHIEPKAHKQGQSRLDPLADDIMDWVEAQPGLTLAEMYARLQAEHGVRAGLSTLHDWLKRHLHLLGKVVFIDEATLNTKMAGGADALPRDRGWWPPPSRTLENHNLRCRSVCIWHERTLGAGRSHRWPAFVTYIKTQLAPTQQKAMSW